MANHEPNSNDEVHVDFTLTEEDLIAFAHWGYHRTWWLWLIRQLVLAYWLLPFLVLASVVGFGLLRNYIAMTWMNVLVLTGLVYTLFTLVSLHRNKPTRTVKTLLRLGHNRCDLGRQRIETAADGLRSTSRGGNEFRRWFSILRIDESHGYAFIYSDFAHAYIVPKRAFKTPAEFEHFVSVARTFHKQAQAYGLVCPLCGYDLAGTPDAGCPECGWRREAAKDAKQQQ